MPGLSLPSSILLEKARFQRNYNWDVLLPDIGVSFHGLAGFGISQLVQKITFEDYSVTETPTIKVGPYETNFIGNLTIREFSMTFLKTMPDAISAYFEAWKKLMIDDWGLYHPKGEYQQTIFIRMLDTTGLAVGRYKLKGCFPINFPGYNLDYATDSVTTVTIHFKMDKIEYEPLG